MRRGGIVSKMGRGPRSVPAVIGDGVRLVAEQIEEVADPRLLAVIAPLQFVAETSAVGVCRQHGVPLERFEDVAAYLLAALQEYVVALVGEFDVEHFEAWIAAQNQ